MVEGRASRPLMFRVRAGCSLLEFPPMTVRLFAPASLLAGLAIAASASASVTEFRVWAEGKGLAKNGTTQTWFGSSAVDGPLMTSKGNRWTTTGKAKLASVVGDVVDEGSFGGKAGAATFDGVLVKPGARTDAVITYRSEGDQWVQGLAVQSELLGKALKGDGVTISVIATLDGRTRSLGTITLAKSADARLDVFTFSGATELHEGDTLSLVISRRGSNKFDQVNVNAWVMNTIPGPGGLVAVAGLLVTGTRRRRA